MGITLVQIDAFTDRPFGGNPAAVCVSDEMKDSAWMQQVAAEMNLSETAFVYPEGEGFRLRWFTPTVEVNLCGHATLATAHALWELGRVPRDEAIRFQTRSGLLVARREGVWIELEFPADPPQLIPALEGLDQALGVEARSVSQSHLQYVVVEVTSDAIVREMQPDFNRLATFPVHGVIVTSEASGSEYDFVSRFFAPTMGINEDPVTGSAHCVLAPFWQHRLGKDEFVAYQASWRGGVVRVRLKGDRAILGGQAVTVLRGELV
jgi:PhzF family phenazine biosynthesis protein